MSTILRSRILLVGIVVVVLVGGSAAGIYIHSRSNQTSQHTIPAAARPSAPPSINVGAQTVKGTAAAEFLGVASTSPAANTTGVALNAPITIAFNLPVDPDTAGNSINILPAITGTWAQGQTNAEVRFTPSALYTAGTSVSVVIHSGFTSRDGFALKGDYQFGFVTVVGSADVLFQTDNGTVAKLLNVAGGHAVNISLQTGDQVPGDIVIKTYRVTINDLLAGLVYDSNGAYSSSPIDTSRLQLLDTKGPVKNSDQFAFSQPDGIYLVLAADANGQYGSLWVDVSKYGVLMRQDDQRIVLAGEDLTTGDTTPTFNLTFYTLKGTVVSAPQATFTSTAEFPSKYPSTYDLAVATSGGETVVVPMSAPTTDADIKVIQDLSVHPQIYVITDKAAYSKGDTVKFAGVVRVSNDQQYAIPANAGIEVWMDGSPAPVDLTVKLGADGTFSGSFPVPASVFNSDGSDAIQEVYASIAGAPKVYPLSNTFIVAVGPHAPAAKLAVTFDKTEYVARDTITATIAATTPTGSPLAGQSVTVTIFSADHRVSPRELGSFASRTSWGTAIKDPFNVALDSSGHATYAFNANLAGRDADQEVTVEVTFATGAAQAVGAKTAVVYQAADEVFLLPSRSAYAIGDQVVAPFVVETRAGDRIPNAPMSYELDETVYSGNTSTTTVAAGGSITTDVNGFGIVRAAYHGSAAGIVLKVKGNDSAGNTFEDTKWLNIAKDSSGLVTFNGIDMLVQLEVTLDKVAYNVGGTANVTVTAPANENVLMSLERGRIHLYKWVALKAGDNQLSLNVTPDLAPGFTLMFSYFRNGAYVSEGLPIPINTSDRLLKVTVTPDQKTYTSGQTAHLTVTVTDSAGKPVAATLLADGYDALMSSYKLVDAASIGGTFYTPALRATNGSSSLVGIGNWGGRCGGGGPGDQLAVTLAGRSDLWSAGVVTDTTTGQLTVDVPVTGTAVRVLIAASTSATSVGQAELDLNVA